MQSGAIQSLVTVQFTKHVLSMIKPVSTQVTLVRVILFIT